MELSTKHLRFSPERMAEVRWSKGSCGVSGCSDPECVCALCAQPIGTPENSPLWEGHDEDCDGCELCMDEVPIILFRGEGKDMTQAAFHTECFKKLMGR
jgi:hypothetical protein